MAMTLYLYIIIGRSLVLLKAPNSFMNSQVLLRALMRSSQELSTFGTCGQGTSYIYIYIFVGRSLALLKAPENSRELSSAFKSTHKVLLKVTELQNLQPWHKICFENTWKILGALESTRELS
jgi:hypothetical protein